jgi:hypothetical protein
MAEIAACHHDGSGSRLSVVPQKICDSRSQFDAFFDRDMAE